MILETNALATATTFSSEDGIIWMHVPSGIAPIPLGDAEIVTGRIREFLAQFERRALLADPATDTPRPKS